MEGMLYCIYVMVYVMARCPESSLFYLFVFFLQAPSLHDKFHVTARYTNLLDFS